MGGVRQTAISCSLSVLVDCASYRMYGKYPTRDAIGHGRRSGLRHAASTPRFNGACDPALVGSTPFREQLSLARATSPPSPTQQTLRHHTTKPTTAPVVIAPTPRLLPSTTSRLPAPRRSPLLPFGPIACSLGRALLPLRPFLCAASPSASPRRCDADSGFRVSGSSRTQRRSFRSISDVKQ